MLSMFVILNQGTLRRLLTETKKVALKATGIVPRHECLMLSAIVVLKRPTKQKQATGLVERTKILATTYLGDFGNVYTYKR